MRIATVNDRASLIIGDDDRAVDIHAASGGRFGPEPAAVFEHWDEFRKWVDSAELPEPVSFAREDLGSPSPAPRQVFGIGLNYSEHAAESGFAKPTTAPPVFTKFPSCITGPYGEVVLPAGGHTDWEVELVVVIGTKAHRVARADAWQHVAGLSVGQDISERISQMAAVPPQFSLGKSFPGFGPIGPWLVTVEEFANPDDLELGCAINGEQMQLGRTSSLIFSVSELIEQLSAVAPLLPGDVVFTGTPAGVGLGRDPQRWLAAGDELVTHIEGIGEMRHRFVADAA
ncbi:fumarylacetoacetate hydrolase family protein [Catenulispora pinisilvae]|uniref:fumarylacetoacetate hydrolase family protein n=1 Tax=Catenulispora pinisilvae TaxID=2705253 RepID=UPI001890D2DD|nr:fumarylacetoacetate hydrolase family protein [Catenulispora pinisilvae]